MDSIGARIKMAREAAGITQEQLGQKVGVTGVTIMRYEKGQREPTFDTLQAIADALDVTTIYLIGHHSWTDIQLHNALKRKDLQALEKILVFPKGYLSVLPEDELQQLADFDSWYVLSHKEIKDHFQQAVERRRMEHIEEVTSRERTIALAVQTMQKLNDYGLRVAIERIEELTEIPRYHQKEVGPDASGNESNE